MVKVIVTSEFFLGKEKFSELKNIERANLNQKEEGHLYINDKFECNEAMYEFLVIKNLEKRAFVQIIEIIPEEEKEIKPRRRRKIVEKD